MTGGDRGLFTNGANHSFPLPSRQGNGAAGEAVVWPACKTPEPSRSLAVHRNVLISKIFKNPKQRRPDELTECELAPG